MRNQPRPVFRSFGGKHALAPWIVGLMQQMRPCKTYVEPCCGAGSVFMARPRVFAEVLGDVDDDINKLFVVLRDKASAKDLTNLLRLTPFSRAEFHLAFEPCDKEDLVERARRLLVRSFMGFGSAATADKREVGFRCNVGNRRSLQSHDWATYPNWIEAFHERLQGVMIENVPAVSLVARLDAPDTLFYVDPPYVHETRGDIRNGLPKTHYRHEMTDDDHRALAASLRAASGMVMISGYASALYDEELYPDWTRLTKPTYGEGHVERTEVVWINAAGSALPRDLFASEFASKKEPNHAHSS